MILVVSVNPAWDVTYYVDCFVPGKVHRVGGKSVIPGGKGFNVARVAARLGAEVRVMGFAPGGTVRRFEASLAEYGIDSSFESVEAEVRAALAIVSQESGETTEVLEPGGPITGDEADRFLDRFDGLLQEADLVVMSGSLPPGLPDDYYAQLIRLANERQVRSFLDTSGTALRKGLAGRAYLVKLNLTEALDLCPWQVDNLGARTPVEIGRGVAGYLSDLGIRTPVVSLGPMGAVLRCGGRTLHGRTEIDLSVVNTVGAGDAMLAAMAVAYCHDEPIET